jgi:hypothetical protein
MTANRLTRALLIARAIPGARVAGLPPDPCSAMTTPSPAGEAAAAGISVTICTSRRRYAEWNDT